MGKYLGPDQRIGITLHSYILALISSVMVSSRLALPPFLTRSVTAVGEDSLTSNPLTLCDKELDDGGNVLDIRQAVANCLALVKFDSLRGFLRVEES